MNTVSALAISTTNSAVSTTQAKEQLQAPSQKSFYDVLQRCASKIRTNLDVY